MRIRCSAAFRTGSIVRVRGAARLLRCSRWSDEGCFIVHEAGILRSHLLVKGACLLFAPTRHVDLLMILDARALLEAQIVPRLLR